jgi:hypothetical protein
LAISTIGFAVLLVEEEELPQPLKRNREIISSSVSVKNLFIIIAP